MAFRHWAPVLAGALALIPTAGCSLARGVLGGTGGAVDGGTLDVGGGRRDVGPQPDTGILTPDTGILTPDTGILTPDTGIPTPDTGVAMPDTGVVCPTSCPLPVTGAWGACDFGTDLCRTTGGTQTRMVTTYACSGAGTCEATITTESQACTRPTTDGHMCAAPSYGDWSTCAYGDPCTRTGMQTRIATTSHCAGGACVATDTDEAQACTRSTEGLSCGAVVVGPWSTCMVDPGCGATGMQTRTTTTPSCMGGTCQQAMSTEDQICSAPSGGACGPTTCGAYGTCTQTMPGTCDRTGTRMRTCTTPICSGGGAGASCIGSNAVIETQACSASVGGVSCTSRSCTGCREPGRFDCRAGHQGQRRCSTTNGTCMDVGLGPYCGGSFPSYSTEACSC